MHTFRARLERNAYVGEDYQGELVCIQQEPPEIGFPITEESAKDEMSQVDMQTSIYVSGMLAPYKYISRELDLDYL